MLIKAFSLAAAAAALTAPAHAPRHAAVCQDGDCSYEDSLTPEQQARLDEKKRKLDARLAVMNRRIEAQVDAAMKRADVQIQLANARAAAATVRAERIRAEFPPEKIDAIVAHAMEQARAGEIAAREAERAVARIQPQIEAMTRNLENMDIDVDVDVDDQD
jgi:hypothetical protein